MEVERIRKPLGLSLMEQIVRSVQKPIEHLEKYRKMVDKKYLDAAEGCIRCVSCKMQHSEYSMGVRWGELCPSLAYNKFESHAPYGRINMIVGLIRGELQWTQGFVNALYSCSSCGACSEICDFMQEINPPGVELELDNPPRPLDIIEEFKAVGVVEGIGPMPAQKRFAEYVERVHNPYNEPHELRTAWFPEDMKKPPTKSKLMYHVGCTSSYRQKEIARATVKILNKLGIEYGITPDEVCCGSPLFRTGQREAGLKTLRKLIKVLEDTGAETVFTSCAGCYRVLKADAPKHGIELPFEVIHTIDIIKRAGKLDFKREWKEKVTYHDPCHVGRHLGYYEPPREVLKGIPGIEFVEMHRNRKWSWCCGAGAGIKAAFPDQAVWAAGERLWEAQDVGATSLISICPFCKRNLGDAIPKVQPWVNIKVYDLTEVIWEVIR